mmetsp:Transcript_40775/g.106164  ORF Transcript_40775/g.106164 Transcript_40775/m.106164 type:complete len:238 (-) Transcript_40775:609-1322(-)
MREPLARGGPLPRLAPLAAGGLPALRPGGRHGPGDLVGRGGRGPPPLGRRLPVGRRGLVEGAQLRALWALEGRAGQVQLGRLFGVLRRRARGAPHRKFAPRRWLTIQRPLVLGVVPEILHGRRLLQPRGRRRDQASHGGAQDVDQAGDHRQHLSVLVHHHVDVDALRLSSEPLHARDELHDVDLAAAVCIEQVEKGVGVTDLDLHGRDELSNFCSLQRDLEIRGGHQIVSVVVDRLQ